MSSEKRYAAMLQVQRAYFESGATKDYAFRRAMLLRLREAIKAWEERLLAAVKADLAKPEFEAFSSEIGILYMEISHALKNLRRWMRPEKVRVEAVHWPGSARIYKDPYGSALIISPWNYPVQLLLSPLIGAIAGGNTAVLKPSEIAPACEKALQGMIDEFFDPAYIAVVTGGVRETGDLLALPFDTIFFTGSPQVGKIVMRAAAENLVPVTLELGGKSPVIVDATANLDLAAHKIVWGKFSNAGQICVAPDYVLVHRDVREALQEKILDVIKEFFGDDPSASPDFARIISDRHVERIGRLLDGQAVLAGGQIDAAQRYIAPTVVADPDWESPLMQEEIFGPLLPLHSFDSLEQAVSMVRTRPKPLALYVFTGSRKTEARIMRELTFGGGGVNSVVLHVASSRLPFGGVGTSGIGQYHGQASFAAFTHRKTVLRQSGWLDLGITYPGKQLPLSILRRVMK